jgi:hypothetical protein
LRLSFQQTPRFSEGGEKLDIFKRQEVLSIAHHGFDEPIEPIGLTPNQIKEKKGLVREILVTGVILFKK